MSPLSSSTLFHFTNCMKNLLGILKEEFIPHYSLEDYALVLGGQQPKDLNIAIPMVCFCDIPLSQAADHITTYGRYSIGLTKSWGMKAGVAPILYTYPNSATTEAFLYLHLQIEKLQGTLDDEADFNPRTERFLCFVKPYEGKLYGDASNNKCIRFYDEREWRYVPYEGWHALSFEEFMDKTVRTAANQDLRQKKWRLSFEPADIRYIVVAEEDEIRDVLEEVRRIKSSKYSPEDINLLCTRIVSAKQISEDF